MPITFYGTRSVPSPPVRAVEIVMKILKLDLERRDIDLMAKENLEPWFVELNPTHQVPALDDNGYILTDCHAIITYLLTSYAPKYILEQYYPTDPKERGIIDSRLHFESGTLFARGKAIGHPLLMWGDKETCLEKVRWLVDGVEFLEQILEGKEWIAGDRLTVADISTITTIDLTEVLVPFKHYKNISVWSERVRKSLPFYEEIPTADLDLLINNFKKNFAYDAEDLWNQVQSGMKK